jgi:UDP-N-acetyl-D-mannosaminuronic acid dehydrogenase
MALGAAGRMNGIERLCIRADASLRHVLERFDAASADSLPSGIVLVLDDDGRLAGTVTEGDVRRALLGAADMDAPAASFMQTDPIFFPEDLALVDVLERLPEELARRGRRSRKYLGKVVLVDSDRRPTRVLDYHQLWEQRVATHRHVVVVGLGYVGLTLALALADEGFLVSGIDTDPVRVAMLSEGKSYVHESGLPELLHRHLGSNFRASLEPPDGGDVYVVAVGTPLAEGNGGREARMDDLLGALDLVAAHLRPGNLVVLRSTVPVGTSSQVAIPHLERRSGLRCGVDFHLAFAPERTAEGRALTELRELPQIIGGFNDDSVEATAALFRELTTTLVRVESLEAAELAKLINNSFRDLVFAFANEAALLAAQFDLDVVEVIKAANKGYGRDPVPLPSPGVGGPCLTKDPHIMAAIRGRDPSGPTLSEHGRAVNERMCEFVVERILEQLLALRKDPARCRVVACGIAFKGRPETADVRESTGVAIARRLQAAGAEVFGHDYVVQPDVVRACGIEPVDMPDGGAGADAVLFLNNHPLYAQLDLSALVATMAPRPLVFDGWHAFRSADVLGDREAAYLGLSFARVSSAGQAVGERPAEASWTGEPVS